MQKRFKPSNRIVARLALVCVAMFGFGYALVPLYDVFCDLTGLRFTDKTSQPIPQAVVEDTSRLVTVEFDVSLNKRMPWQVQPAVSHMQVRPGRVYTTSYIAKNQTQAAMIGQAVPSVTPYAANKHLVKTECFCFERQVIEAGQEVAMPLSFMLNPKLPRHVKVVTLSYTFFDITQNAEINNADSKQSLFAFEGASDSIHAGFIQSLLN